MTQNKVAAPYLGKEGLTDSETLYTMALTAIKGLGPSHALTLYRATGGATALFENLTALEQKLPKKSHKILQILNDGKAESLRRVQEEADFCQQHGIQIICLNDKDYPDRLRQCGDAPLVLYYRGTADLNAVHIISMVGTRRCTEYGKELCADIVSELAHLCPDALVVSGLAYGIDIHSHRAALDSGLSTVAVLAHGLDRIYPYAHRSVAKRMLSQGGLLTEYMTGTTPDKGNFVRRNRIIAGLCDGCIVVESAQKGGAIITARLAFDYDRQIFACPGRLGDEYSEGCNKIIHANEASLYLSADKMVKELGWMTEQEQQEALQKPVEQDLFPDLTAEEQQIVEQLHQSEDGFLIDQLANGTSLPVYKVSTSLFELEMKGLVKLLPGGVYRLLRK